MAHFRLNTATFFLTYPQCPIQKEWVRDWLLNKLDVQDYVVAHEKHQNGDDHLHIYVKTLTKHNFLDPKCLDILFDGEFYHGNYQGCRSAKNVLKYCTKDEDYVSNMDIASLLNKTSLRKQVAVKIHQGVPLEQLYQEHPEIIYDYKKIKQNVQEIALDSYVPVERVVTCKWMWGATGTGKTRRSIAEFGGDYKKIYMKANNKWWDGYFRQPYVLLDELDRAQNKWIHNFLKRWCDRYPCLLEIKGGTVYNQYTHFFVTCQHSIDEFFTDDQGKLVIPQQDVDAVKRRFIEEHI